MTEQADLPCESLPPLPQEEVKRGVEQERARATDEDDWVDETDTLRQGVPYVEPSVEDWG